MTNKESQSAAQVSGHLSRTIKRFLIMNMILFAIEIGVLLSIYFIVQSQMPVIPAF